MTIQTPEEPLEFSAGEAALFLILRVLVEQLAENQPTVRDALAVRLTALCDSAQFRGNDKEEVRKKFESYISVILGQKGFSLTERKKTNPFSLVD